MALWAVTSYRPFAIVKDPYFTKIISMFNPAADLPSDSTISRDIKDFLSIGQENLQAYFKVCYELLRAGKDANIQMQYLPGVVHIALDTWTAPNTLSYMGVVAIFLDPKETAAGADDGTGVLKYPIKTIILDFITLFKAHTGEYLAGRLLECLDFFGITLKVFRPLY